jgi:hypothetical protein
MGYFFGCVITSLVVYYGWLSKERGGKNADNAYTKK